MGPWLAEPKCHEWDALVFWRADRAVRSMADMFGLTQWAQRMHKVIVFVSGPFGGDPLTLDPRQNSADPHVNLPGYGYRIVDHPIKGRTIQRDDYAAAVIREIAEWLCDGESVNGVVHKLNERGELTNRDRVRVEQGKPTRSRGRGAHTEIDRELWTTTAITTIMTSPRLLGYKVHKGKPAAGPDGAPVQIAEPVLSHEEFQRVRNALDARSKDRRRTRGTTPLLGVVKCGVCGSNASRRINQPAWEAVRVLPL